MGLSAVGVAMYFVGQLVCDVGQFVCKLSICPVYLGRYAGEVSAAGIVSQSVCRIRMNQVRRRLLLPRLQSRSAPYQ